MKKTTSKPIVTSQVREVETSVLPLKYVDFIEDLFHAVLAIALLGIGIGAFFFSIKRLFETAPFFPNGMIQGVNDILFIVIILEILRTVISRFTDGVYQLDKFLIIGLIAAFTGTVLFLIFKYESNKKNNRPRLTGRGGDFE